MRVQLVTSALCCALALFACGRGSRGDSPIATVRHFLEVMDRSGDEESALRDAYALLDASAKASLARRAERATMLSGHSYEPWQMIAQGRFGLHFVPASPGGMHEHIQGDSAIVTVTGDKPGQRAQVSLVREQGKWRIRLEIPPMRNAEPSTPQKDDG